MLLFEEAEHDGMGPCMEFMLQYVTNRLPATHDTQQFLLLPLQHASCSSVHTHCYVSNTFWALCCMFSQQLTACGQSLARLCCRRSGVLKHLVHCGQFTWPVGIMGRVLVFFARLLEQIKQVSTRLA
jgi:GTP cyclohydrolase II